MVGSRPAGGCGRTRSSGADCRARAWAGRLRRRRGTHRRRSANARRGHRRTSRHRRARGVEGPARAPVGMPVRAGNRWPTDSGHRRASEHEWARGRRRPPRHRRPGGHRRGHARRGGGASRRWRHGHRRGRKPLRLRLCRPVRLVGAGPQRRDALGRGAVPPQLRRWLAAHRPAVLGGDVRPLEPQASADEARDFWYGSCSRGNRPTP